MQKKLEDELDQLADEEIEKRLAAAVWVDDKRAAVLRYLEEKKLGRKKEAQVAELEAARSAKDAAWAAVDAAKTAPGADGEPRHHHSERGGGSSHLRSGGCFDHSLYEALRGVEPSPRRPSAPGLFFMQGQQNPSERDLDWESQVPL